MPFRSLLGHRPLTELLSRAAERASLPPSLIFSGPDGVGKRAAAVALAQVLNCERPIGTGQGGIDACGSCGPCLRIARGVHADVLLVEPGDTGAIKIDQVRDAVDRSGYRPFEGKRRVVIIDEADALVVEAQNALLKTLEEPPPASVFVLVTARPDLLLITVRSRCHRLRFGQLSSSDVAAVLVRDHEFSAAAAAASAAASDGSVARALEEDADDAREVREAASSLLQAASGSSDPRRRLDGAKGLTGAGSERDDVIRRVRAVSSLLRDMALLSAQADDRALANRDVRPQLERWLRGFDPDRLVASFGVVDRALSALDRNASPKIVADWLAIHL